MDRLSETRYLICLHIQTGLTSEKYSRSSNEKSGKFFQHLSLDEISGTEKNFQGFRRPVCYNFMGLCALSIIWDLMILTTAMYYHSMIEKFVSGLIAIFTWFITYRGWFPMTGFPPVPGAGNFKYFERKNGGGAGSLFGFAANGVGKTKK
ncbi:hypothetical protein M8J76_012218 [Diaphorina citri]|nr:hypothetical protein M8J75_013107 [Diaphorina citri]KAI5716776.1 hypothetical protein M8J76_012218 [Diaphorina citri]KAI5717893.1 hypothetical protein M8J77_013147 [Diaphorina citri]